MKLSYKLFISYLLVVVVALVVLATAVTVLAPVNFSQHMAHMRGGGMMGGRMQQIDAELEANFRAAVRSALTVAALVAVVVALGVSWFVSQQIVRPLRSLGALSQQIANGNYQHRLELQTGDELAELVESFNRMTESLANTEAMRVQLLGDVTHELKTPLASIKGYMEALQDGVLPPTPENFQLIHREADRLQRLVQDLQALSRAEAGQVPLEIQPHAPAEIIRPVVERMRPQFNEQGITLTLALPANLPQVNADADRTAQVLTNLLGNALQYTVAGGEVRVEAEREPGAVRFSVIDNGVGLDAADLNLIFQRFYRVDKSRARSSGGSGIGLTVAKHLVEVQGGHIWAESAGLGRGSHFYFTVPVA